MDSIADLGVTSVTTMKITQLDIEGFRSLKKVSWKPGDLNVIIGPNGSGKSNLLRMLELISAGAQGRLSKHIQSEGGMNAIVWDGQADTVGFTIHTSSVSEKHSLPGLTYSIDLPNLNYNVELTRLGSGSAYRVGTETLIDADTGVPYIKRKQLRAAFYDDDKAASLPSDALSEEELTLKLITGPFIKNTTTPAFQQQLSNWTIYQDFRTDRSSTVRQDAVSRHERRVAPDGQHLINVLHTLYIGDREFKQLLNSAMYAAFGSDFEELIFPPSSDQRIQLRVRWKTLKRETYAADLSDGTLRFLFLMAVLADPSPSPLIAIDEPETGLHPSMLPIVAEFAVEAARRSQVVLTTHSDTFLDAFRVTNSWPTTTVAKWEGGETTLTTLNGNELDHWLKDYSLGSLFRTGILENMA